MELLKKIRLQGADAEKQASAASPGQMPEQPCRVIELRHPTEQDRELLHALSFSEEHLWSALAPSSERQRELVGEAGFSEYSGCLDGHFRETESSLLECDCVISCCPVCGRACRSRESYPVRDFCHFTIFYRFYCHGEFFLMKAAPLPIGLYIPTHELVVRYVEEDVSLGQMFYRPEQLEEIIAYFKQLLSVYHAEASAYSDQGGGGRMHYMVGSFNPIGHHMVNELPGMQRLIDSGLSQRLAHVIEPLYRYFDLKELFPEVGTLEDWSEGREKPSIHGARVFRRALQQNAFVVNCYHVGIMQETLDRRLLAYVEKKVRPEIVHAIEATRGHWPRLWITLRSGSRSWVKQNEGLTAILTALYELYPHMVAVFDGVPKETEDMAAIVSSLPLGLWWFDALHLSREETIFWCHFIDAHLSPVGNGAVFLSMANKPGVYHGNSRILKYYCSEGEAEGTFVLHPREGAVGNLSAASLKDYTPDKDMHFCSYEADVADMIAKLKKIFNTQPPDRMIR